MSIKKSYKDRGFCKIGRYNYDHILGLTSLLRYNKELLKAGLFLTAKGNLFLKEDSELASEYDSALGSSEIDDALEIALDHSIR